MIQVKTLPGLARDVAVGADGAVWKVGADGRIARWHQNETEWQLVAKPPEPAERIAVHRDGSPWVVGAAGRVHRFQDGHWQTIHASARHLSATAASDGMVMVDKAGRLHEWNEVTDDWQLLPQSPQDAAEAAALTLSHIWYIRLDGRLGLWAGEVIDPTGHGRALSCAPGEWQPALFLLDDSRHIWLRDHDAERWQSFDATDRGALRLAAHPDDSVLIVDADGRTFWLIPSGPGSQAR